MKAVNLVLWLLLLLFWAADAQDCSSHTTCSDCLEESSLSCGWCNVTEVDVYFCTPITDGQGLCLEGGTVYSDLCPGETEDNSVVSLVKGITTGTSIITVIIVLCIVWRVAKCCCRKKGGQSKAKAQEQAYAEKKQAEGRQNLGDRPLGPARGGVFHDDPDSDEDYFSNFDGMGPPAGPSPRQEPQMPNSNGSRPYGQDRSRRTPQSRNGHGTPQSYGMQSDRSRGPEMYASRSRGADAYASRGPEAFNSERGSYRQGSAREDYRRRPKAEREDRFASRYQSRY
eukprot:TRINITY_DN25583_c0_g1_i1.p1 TRINITY_DN25583_c0_g1~~TRINITY_DN25583_c0_g1_i1.p1  ORF type:complete len:284 (+),score=22.41 TRINITY_DN25583_c0_g1_i1:100-951(+)